MEVGLRKILLTLALAGGLSAWISCAFAQPSTDPLGGPQPGRGTNYDPPPPPKKPKPEPEPKPVEVEKPIFEFAHIDWEAKETWVKVALLVGSIILARRAFNQMKG